MNTISRWVRMGIATGLGLAISTTQPQALGQDETPPRQGEAAPSLPAPTAAPSLPAPAAAVTELTIGNRKIPISGHVRAINILSDNRMDLTMDDGSVVPVTGAAAPTLTSLQGTLPSPRTRLTPEQSAYIREDLERMMAGSTVDSPELVRDQLMAKAEQEAAAFLRMPLGELASQVPLRRELRALVESVIGNTPLASRTWPAIKTPGRGVASGARDHSEVERGSQGHCDCDFCQPVHPRSTCPLPYGYAPSVAVAYAPVLPYGAAYAPRKGFLHHLLCPCSWCRGRR